MISISLAANKNKNVKIVDIFKIKILKQLKLNQNRLNIIIKYKTI